MRRKVPADFVQQPWLPHAVKCLPHIQEEGRTKFILFEGLTDYRSNPVHLFSRGVFRAKPKLMIGYNVLLRDYSL